MAQIKDQLPNQPLLERLVTQAESHIYRMAPLPHLQQVGQIRAMAKEAAIIIALSNEPGGLGMKFVRGQALVGTAHNKPILAWLTMCHTGVSLWHLAYGDQESAREARRKLRLVDPQAPDRVVSWLAPAKMHQAMELGNRARPRFRPNPFDRDIPAEIHAAVAYTRHWQQS